MSERLVEDGARVVERLDESGVKVPAALWILFADAQAWKLALSLQAVSDEGPKYGYRLVQKALSDLEGEIRDLALEDIAVLKPDAPLLRLLRVALRTGEGVSRIQFVGNVISGELFPDALIYRVT